MAKIQFGSMLGSDARGKFGGGVFSKNRNGAYVRRKVTPSNPQTAAQLQARSRLTAQSQAWRGLSQADRNSFDAAAPQFAKTDVFGNSYAPTGKNLFTLLNINLALAGGSPLAAAPLPREVEQPVAGTLTVAEGGAKTIAYTGTTDASKVLVFACAPQSPGKRYVKNQMRLIASFNGDTASPLNIASAYVSKFGEPPAGTFVAVELQAVNLTTGQASQRSKATTLVS